MKKIRNWKVCPWINVEKQFN